MKYIGYYGINRGVQRDFVLSATNKMDYIINSISETGQTVEIISASGSASEKKDKGKKINLGENKVLKLFPTIGRSNVFMKLMDRWIISFCLFLYLLINIKKNENVLVYHSLGYMKCIFLLKKIRKFRLILEVEELYADVIGDNHLKNKELKFFQLADAYIFPTELLDEQINTLRKPYVIVYGTYHIEEPRSVSAFPCENRIHLVYAGTLDPRKGGCQVAINVATELSNKYHLHILGFGSKQDIEKLKKMIKDNCSESSARISYDGLLYGENYIRFLQTCQIGLSTQIPGAIFNESSFPSKVLSYMANGLRVVSVKIKVLESSQLNKWLYYYEGSSPKEIAQTIYNVNFSDGYDSRSLLHKLDDNFRKELNSLLIF